MPNYLGGTNKCKRCGENLKPGKYIAQTMVLKTCLKCPDCGWSVTMGGRVLEDPREPKQPGWWIETRPWPLRYVLYVILTVVSFSIMALVGIALMALVSAIFMWSN